MTTYAYEVSASTTAVSCPDCGMSFRFPEPVGVGAQHDVACSRCGVKMLVTGHADDNTFDLRKLAGGHEFHVGGRNHGKMIR